MYLRCVHCQHHWLVDLAGRVALLRGAGKLGPRSLPGPDLVDGLIVGALGVLACPSCHELGLEQATEPSAAEAIENDPEAWGESRRCRDCGKLIPEERLEVLPDTYQCTGCAQRGEGEPEEVDYCPHCGGRVALVQRPGAGLTRYVLRCSGCGSYV